MHADLSANLTRRTDFGEGALAKVIARFTPKSYAKNEHHFYEGSRPDYFYYIRTGVCRTCTLKSRPGEALTWIDGGRLCDGKTVLLVYHFLFRVLPGLTPALPSG